MWIGVVADTQGEIHPKIVEVFDGMDFIIHCGGIGSPSVLEELSHISPVSGVIGTGDSVEDYPFGRVLSKTLGGVSVMVSHRVGTPSRPTQATKKLILENNPEVVLFGYASEPFNGRVEKCLWVHPGSASGKRGRVTASVGILEVDGQSVRAEIVPLP